MAFISNCPLCQKSVLVPDGHAPDAVVQCPACFAEYPLGDILAAAPPALIVVRPGSTAAVAPAAVATLAVEDVVMLGGPAAAEPAELEGGLFGAHRIEPSLHDGETLEFAEEPAAHAANIGQEAIVAHDIEQPGNAIFNADDAVAIEEHPSDAAIEPFAEPLEGEGHESAVEAGEKADHWGDNWVGFGDEPAHAEGDEAEVGLAEPDAGMEDVNFADITGKAAPGAALAEGGVAVAVEPAKKKKRKREANPVVRIIGIVFFGLLALPCALLLAKFAFHQPMDFLPTWVPAWFRTTKVANQTIKPTNQPAVKTPAADTTTPPVGATSTDNSQPAGSGAVANTLETPAATNPPAGTPAATPDASQNKPPVPAAGTEKEVATNDKAGTMPKTPALDDGNESTEPPTPLGPEPQFGAPDKNAAAPPPPVLAPINSKPKTEVKSDATAKPQATSPDSGKLDATDPFASPAPPAPGSEKPKTDLKPEAPKPVKPDMTAKPQATVPDSGKPDASDPFAPPAPPAPTAPGSEKPKTDIKPEAPKPVTPTKPDTTAKPQATAPNVEKPKLDVPTPVKPEVSTPNVPNPAKPELKPEPPMPKPVKPDLQPTPVKPEPVKPELKPAVGPLNAASFAAGDLDAAMKAAPVSGNVDAKSYAAWCKLAEVATFASGQSAEQKQSIHGLVGKVVADPKAAGAIAAQAKKLLDDKVTKGGIVLAGKVTKIASRNGLFGTAIRMDGMPNAVMVFSSHALDIKEDQSVLVLGALVSEPAKNLPGYSGKQPVIVWSDFAAPTP